jgi:3-carboxy-cis,cis-muconate cycloisomerase
MSTWLIDSLGTTDALAEVFSDASVIRAMVDFEIALARAAARAGAIPPGAADTIERAVDAGSLDARAIAREARRSGTPSVPLVQALIEQVRAVDPESASRVHWGATSQDVTDSALVLLLKRAHVLLACDHARIDRALRELSNAHAGSVMLGRTLLQPATPITFGLKAAGWKAAISRSWRRLSEAWGQALVVQFGGAAGTRAAVGESGAAVASALATELGLAPAAPWHTDRDRPGAVIAGCGLYAAALGKAARDISLLMQGEVGEVSEPGGGSSAMPQKRNPSGCAIAIAAATRLPGLVSAFLAGMIQEHERSVGGGHAEWPIVSTAVQATGASAAAMAGVVEGLEVHPERMRRNLEATYGTVFAERAVMMLALPLGREAANELVKRAVRQSRETGRAFGETLAAIPEASRAVPAQDLREVDRPGQYLGEAESLRKQLLEE